MATTTNPLLVRHVLMSSVPLISATDPAAVEFVHRAGKAPVLLTCDHASRLIPYTLGKLGLPDDIIARHIGWDIGAAEVTRRLAPLLDTPAILAGYSRLVIDCNRDPDDPTSIPPESDGIVIPGNAALAPTARQARREALFEPFHRAIETWIAARQRSGLAPGLVSIHSFTPEMQGVERPWHIGVLWDNDGRIATPLLEALRAERGIIVGDNEPYTARDPVGYTQRHHGLERGLPHVAIELRQDLVADGPGASAWAERLARVLKPILAARELYVAIAPPPPHS